MIRPHLPALPKTRAGRAFAFVALVDSIGTGFFLAGSAIFFVLVLGLSPAQIGGGLALASLIGLLTTVPLSIVADRVGAKRALIGLHLWRAAWFTGLAFVSGPVAFTIVATCIAIGDRGVSPLTRAVVSSAVGEADRTATLALMRSIRNVGFSIGAAMAAPLIAVHATPAYQAVILADAVSFILAAVALRRVQLVSKPASSRKPSPLLQSLAFRDLRYGLLTLADGALTLHVSILSIAIPIWAVQQTGAPPALVPGLVLTNTCLAVLLQIRFARGGDSLAGGTRAMRRSGVCLAACCLLMAAAWQKGPALAAVLLILATIAMTGGELWEAVGSWTLSYRYAPEERMTQYLAVFSLGLAAQEVVGPLVVTGLVLVNGPIGWLCLGAFFLILRLAIGPLARSLERCRSAEPEHGAPVVEDVAGVAAATMEPEALAEVTVG
jgi:Major Facilitator Superfamily